ncbi:MAG: hypothetical protein QE509_05325 [Gammaproteobacteria bacterium]|nr:hypothetical protein [Gammaproteobacteria bacterium]
MTSPWRWILGALLLVGITLPLLLLSRTPAVDGPVHFDSVRAARARALIRDNDPRQLRNGEERMLLLSADELSLLVGYLLSGFPEGAATVKISPQALTASLSFRLPRLPLAPYLNIVLRFTQTDGLPDLTGIRVGALQLPASVSELLAHRALDLAYAALGLSDPGSLIREVAFETDRLRLRYEWQDRVAEVFRAQIIPPEQKARIREFHTQLVAITARAPRVASLPALAGPLFAYAAASAGERDPVADNRAALLVLARYVNGSSLELLLPEASQWPKPTPLSVRLHGRHDLAQHFLISALLTATGSNAIANSVGVAKELDDARHGSGFSFVDLLADEAGNRFGERATASRESALALQQLAASGRRDADWLPSPEGLRERLSEAEFRQRYGGLEDPAFREVMHEIGARLDRLTLYQPAP